MATLGRCGRGSATGRHRRERDHDYHSRDGGTTPTRRPVLRRRHMDPPLFGATIDVIDSSTEKVYFRVPEAQPADMDRAVAAARRAFDEGPWPALTHSERAEYLQGSRQASGRGPRTSVRSGPASPARSRSSRGTGRPVSPARSTTTPGSRPFPFEEPAQPTQGEFGLLVREPVGVVGAIIPWNAPIGLITYKSPPPSSPAARWSSSALPRRPATPMS